MGRPRDLSTRAVRRVRTAARADGADRSGLSALLTVHALHAAGDALIAVALAGTLFFSVPIGEARSRVALYLLLTMLPFALLVPVAGPVLDRFPHGRRNVLALTTGGRGLLTWVMAGATATLGLYPLALAVLVLSRAYGVARSAAVPRVRPDALGLVSANARLNIAAVSAGAVAAGARLGPQRAASGRAGCCAWPASCSSSAACSRCGCPSTSTRRPTASRRRHRASLLSRSAAEVTDAARRRRRAAGRWPACSRCSWPSCCGPTARPGCSSALVVGAAALGQLSGTTLAARLPEGPSRLLSGVALGGPFVACLGAAAGRLRPLGRRAAGATGVSVSLSRFALDAALQEHVTSRSLGSAFARSETALQLAWVLGAFVAVRPAGDRRPLGFAVAARAAAARAAAGPAAAAARARRGSARRLRGWRQTRN